MPRMLYEKVLLHDELNIQSQPTTVFTPTADTKYHKIKKTCKIIAGCAVAQLCAVAQHCYNGDVSLLWENGNLTAVKSKPLNTLIHNLSGLIKSTRGMFVPNLVKFRSWGTSGQRGEILLFCVTYLFIYLFIFFGPT